MATRATASPRDALAGATDALAAAGVQSPRLDAELLLAEASGLDRAQIAVEPDAPLSAGVGRAFAAAVRRRLRREPVAYLIGRKGFRNLELGVDPRVLIPRPETELLVEIALELKPASLLDVGTGSGAVALAVADELPGAVVVATDREGAALEVARANAERLGLQERVQFERGTLPRGDFDLLVANLPYVSEVEWEGLEPEIREFEPRAALVAGPTGLEAIESLLASVARAERPPASVALEVGQGQAPAVADAVRAAGYAAVEARPDLAGIDRVVLGRR